MTPDEYLAKIDAVAHHLQEMFDGVIALDGWTQGAWRMAARELLISAGVTPVVSIPAADGSLWIRVTDALGAAVDVA